MHTQLHCVHKPSVVDPLQRKTGLVQEAAQAQDGGLLTDSESDGGASHRGGPCGGVYHIHVTHKVPGSTTPLNAHRMRQKRTGITCDGVGFGRVWVCMRDQGHDDNLLVAAGRPETGPGLREVDRSLGRKDSHAHRTHPLLSHGVGDCDNDVNYSLACHKESITMMFESTHRKWATNDKHRTTPSVPKNLTASCLAFQAPCHQWHTTITRYLLPRHLTHSTTK